MPSPSSIFSFDRRNPVLAILIAAALVMVVEASLSGLPDNPVVKRFHADDLPPFHPDWQVMGDSVSRSGIDTNVLATALGDPLVFNAAIPATGPSFSYFILKRDLAAGRAPKAILYAPSPHTFASRHVALVVGGFCTWREIGEVLLTGLKTTETLYGILCKVSFTLRNREELGSWLKTGAEEQVTDPPAATRHPPGHHYATNEILPVLRQPFTVRPFNQLMLENFLQLAKDNHIPVYWATMPVLPAVAEGRKPFNFDADYEAFLADLQVRFGVIMVQRDFLVYDDADFADSIHLNPAGAAQFTRYLGDQLAARAKLARP
jgi:hypothetical protein